MNRFFFHIALLLCVPQEQQIKQASTINEICSSEQNIHRRFSCNSYTLLLKYY